MSDEWESPCAGCRGRDARIEALEAQLAAAREALEKAEYASRKDSLTESERLSCVRTVVCDAISKLALRKDTDQ